MKTLLYSCMMISLITKRTLGPESSLTAHMVMTFTKESQRSVIFPSRCLPASELIVIIPLMRSILRWQDYTGDDVTVNNFFAAILGNKTALTGGTGKVVDSGPNDHIFIYYSDHGGPGVLG